MELTILQLGDCCCEYQTVAPGVNDGQRTHIPVSGYLLRLDDDSLMLVDTGMSRVHIDDPDATWRGMPQAKALTPAMRREDSLLVRLSEIGAAPSDIRYVVNTHLHFDHAGNNDAIAGATFFVQREHYEFAKGNPRCPNQYWNLPTLRYELLDGDAKLFDNIEVIRTPGHVPGHQSVLVRIPETGNVILAGDAVFCQDNYDHDTWSNQGDPETARASAHRLRDIAERENALVIYGHDRQQARSLKYSPFVYR